MFEFIANPEELKESAKKEEPTLSGWGRWPNCWNNWLAEKKQMTPKVKKKEHNQNHYYSKGQS